MIDIVPENEAAMLRHLDSWPRAVYARLRAWSQQHAGRWTYREDEPGALALEITTDATGLIEPITIETLERPGEIWLSFRDWATCFTDAVGEDPAAQAIEEAEALRAGRFRIAVFSRKREWIGAIKIKADISYAELDAGLAQLIEDGLKPDAAVICGTRSAEDRHFLIGEDGTLSAPGDDR